MSLPARPKGVLGFRDKTTQHFETDQRRYAEPVPSGPPVAPVGSGPAPAPPPDVAVDFNGLTCCNFLDFLRVFLGIETPLLADTAHANPDFAFAQYRKSRESIGSYLANGYRTRTHHCVGVM
jgi:hypothetical protein